MSFIFRARYEAHNANVIQNCDPKRLLVINIKEGWRPLCQFLDIPPIEGPLPHINKSGTGDETQEYVSGIMAEYTWRCIKQIIASVITITVLIPATILLIYHFCIK